MKINKKFFIMLIIIFVFILICVYGIYKYVIKKEDPTTKRLLDKKGYSIVYLYCEHNGKDISDYLIVDSNKNIIDTRESITGYSDEELKNVYDTYEKMPLHLYYNVEIRDKTMVYNTSMNNGRNIDTFISEYNKNDYKIKIVKVI